MSLVRHLHYGLRASAVLAVLALGVSTAAACGGPVGRVQVPALNELLDQTLATGTLPTDVRAGVADLRVRIAQALEKDDVALARKLEETAMALLGYEKVWLRCGAGTFEWRRMRNKRA